MGSGKSFGSNLSEMSPLSALTLKMRLGMQDTTSEQPKDKNDLNASKLSAKLSQIKEKQEGSI